MDWASALLISPLTQALLGLDNLSLEMAYTVFPIITRYRKQTQRGGLLVCAIIVFDVKHNPLIIFFLSFLLIFSIPSKTDAHPGRTDSSGGHTCRTNCESWGLGYGEYHYHGGGGSSSGGSAGSSYTAPAQETVQTQEVITLPTNTPVPLRLPTKIPTRIPTKTPTQTLTTVLSPTPTSEPTIAPTRKPVEARAQAAKKQGFFEWLFSLFRGR